MKSNFVKIFIVGLVILLAAGCNFRNRNNSNSTGITSPKQDVTSSGPGGGKYPYSNIIQHKYGSGNTEYWIFEPSSSNLKSAPVIVFNHGWSAMDPGTYGGWIEHIVKRGNIVIFPRYQETAKSPTNTYTDNMLASVEAAFIELSSGNHIKPELDKFAIVGHSVGGILTANLAALAEKNGLPKPRAVMSVEPGKSWTISEKARVNLVDLTSIPSDALLVTVSGEDDKLVKDTDAKKIFNQTKQITEGNKNYVIFQSDSHGTPALSANHGMPTGRSSVIIKAETSKESSAVKGKLQQRIAERRTQANLTDSEQGEIPSVETSEQGVDVFDYNGLWKIFDGLTDSAFYGKNKNYALGNTPEQTSLGLWSDGTPIKPLKVITKP